MFFGHFCFFLFRLAYNINNIEVHENVCTISMQQSTNQSLYYLKPFLYILCFNNVMSDRQKCERKKERKRENTYNFTLYIPSSKLWKCSVSTEKSRNFENFEISTKILLCELLKISIIIIIMLKRCK